MAGKAATRSRPSGGFSMNRKVLFDLKVLSKALDFPQSRIVEALVKERLAKLTPEERQAFNKARSEMAGAGA